MASSSSPPRHLFFLFALAFFAAGAADAWPAWGNGRMFFSKATRPEAVELDKVAVATPAAAAAPDATNSNRASDEFSRPSSGGSHNRGYGLYGRPEESYPEAYFRRGVHHDADKLTTTSAAAATAEQEKEEEATPAGDDDAWLGYPADGSGRGRPRPYPRGQQQQTTTTNAAVATAEQEDAAPARDGTGLGYSEDSSGRGRPMSYGRMRGGQQQQQQPQQQYGMSDTRLYQNGRYGYDVNTGKYGYGRESNPVRTRPEEFNGGRKFGGNAAGGQEYANGNYQEEFGVGHRAGEQVRRYGNGNVAGLEYANGNDHEEFGIGQRAGVQTGRRYDNAAAGYYDANGQYIP